jgi:hypothetical protein
VVRRATTAAAAPTVQGTREHIVIHPRRARRRPCRRPCRRPTAGRGARRRLTAGRGARRRPCRRPTTGWRTAACHRSRRITMGRHRIHMVISRPSIAVAVAVGSWSVSVLRQGYPKGYGGAWRGFYHFCNGYVASTNAVPAPCRRPTSFSVTRTWHGCGFNLGTRKILAFTVSSELPLYFWINRIPSSGYA